MLIENKNDKTVQFFNLHFKNDYKLFECIFSQYFI